MSNKRLRLYTYIGAVFMAAYSSIPAYVNSSFLKNFLDEKGIGWLYALTSIITIILMFITPKLIKRFGNKNILIGFIGLSLCSIIPLVFPTLKVIHSLTAFGIYIVLGYLTRYTLDVYLENISEDKNTGLIRGLYLTFYNFAWLISPLLAAHLASQGSYNLVYGVAGIVLLPLLIITIFGLKENRQIKTPASTAWEEIKYLWQAKSETARNIRDILIIDLFLNFFYAIMVVYMPLYLRNQVGLPWEEVGLIFTIMLLPFVLLELPLGKLADHYLGEKEILIGGLIIISISTIATAIYQSPVWIGWAILLFLTRVGAASIEIMKETYLFKKINGVDAGIVALARINVPLSYLIGPVFASITLAFLDFRYIFLLLGFVMLVGVKFSQELKDTK